MEIGTEISRKIRTAIKGKLQELGAYVDEELPDYIMVMVANKKSQEQMTDDLSLFLGNNTLRFTTWLQGVLDKLRAVTPGSNSLKASEAIIFNSSMPPLKSQSREDRVPQPQQQEKFFSGGASSSQAQHGFDRMSTDASVAARLMSTVKPLQESSPSEDIIDIKLDMDDAFNDDLSFSSESSTNPRKKSVDVSSSRTQRPTAQVYRPPGSTHRLEEHGAIHRLSQSGSVAARQSSFQGSRAATKYYEFQEASRAEDNFRSAMGAHRALQEFDQSRKRKIPVASSVVKVKKFMEEFEEEDEEEEDEEEDYTSHTAGLPSSVSVPSRPERRPTLPPSKQANKNLILKAISEAQESITRTTAYATVPPKQMVPVAPRARPVPEEELILMKSRASMLRYQEVPEEVPVVESRQANKHRMDILSRLHPEKPMEETEAWGQAEERRRDILSRLHPEPVEETSSWEQGSYCDAEGTQNVHPMDSRSFIMKSPKVSKTPPMQIPPTTDTTQQLGRLFQPRENIIPEKPPSPKFIVTLDGVPSPSGYQCDEEMEVEPSVYTDEGGLYTEPNNLLSTTEHSQLMQMNSQEVHTLNAVPSAAPAKAKIHERCKYWPACKNAEQCAYHHPTTVCKAFPKCRFAEKCFFIHPNCKFDAKCTKADCPYTHASRRIAPPPVKQVHPNCKFDAKCTKADCPYTHASRRIAPPPVKQVHPNCKFDAKCTKADCPYTHASRRIAPPPVKQEQNAKSHVKVQCRYFPSCKNTECPFFHPKHCRFSNQCTRPDCEFYHPTTSVPPRHALTWTRSQAGD